jgi:hypothetical protein
MINIDAINDSIKYSVIGFISVILIIASYSAGYDRGHTPKAIMCADELTELVRSREQYIECDVERSALKITGIKDCTFDRCQPMCVEQSRKAVADYVALEREIVCTPAH